MCQMLCRRRLLNICRESLGPHTFDRLVEAQHGSPNARLAVADLAPRLRIASVEFSQPLIASPTLRNALGGDQQPALLPVEQPLHRRDMIGLVTL